MISLFKIYPTLPAKLEEFLFYLFLFALPFQKRVILFSRDWYFNEWRSMALYGTDLLIIALFLFWLINLKKIAPVNVPPKYERWLRMFLAMSAISLMFTSDLAVSFYWFMRLVFFVFLFWYVSGYAVGRFKPVMSAFALAGGAVVQAIWGILQFLRQSDVGMWWFGESMLDPQMRGVAVFYNFVHEKIMRAYGVTPHPNILAVYLLVGLFALLWLMIKYDKYRALIYGSYSIVLMGLLVTFSRTTIAVWMMAFAILFVLLWRNNMVARHQLKALMWVTLAVIIIFSAFFWQDAVARITISANDEAVALRLFYNGKAASSGLKLENIMGVGIGNFVTWFMYSSPNLPKYLYQPAHNIYLLIYSETGILGIASFLAFLLFLGRRFLRRTIISDESALLTITLILSILFLGLFDHFPWTLQQGRIIFWGSLGLLAGIEIKRVNGKKSRTKLSADRH